MKKAFTIIETLVAITILMIAISGPLTAAFRAMTASVASRDQMIANFMAQGAIEYVRNIKDNNIENKADSWLEGLNDCSLEHRCYINALGRDMGLGEDGEGCTTPEAELCKVSSKGTQFYRSFYLTGNTTGDYAEAVVDVFWRTGAYDKSSTTLRTMLHRVVK